MCDPTLYFFNSNCISLKSYHRVFNLPIHIQFTIFSFKNAKKKKKTMN